MLSVPCVAYVPPTVNHASIHTLSQPWSLPRNPDGLMVSAAMLKPYGGPYSTGAIPTTSFQLFNFLQVLVMIDADPIVVLCSPHILSLVSSSLWSQLTPRERREWDLMLSVLQAMDPYTPQFGFTENEDDNTMLLKRILAARQLMDADHIPGREHNQPSFPAFPDGLDDESTIGQRDLDDDHNHIGYAHPPGCIGCGLNGAQHQTRFGPDHFPLKFIPATSAPQGHFSGLASNNVAMWCIPPSTGSSYGPSAMPYVQNELNFAHVPMRPNPISTPIDCNGHSTWYGPGGPGPDQAYVESVPTSLWHQFIHMQQAPTGANYPPGANSAPGSLIYIRHGGRQMCRLPTPNGMMCNYFWGQHHPNGPENTLNGRNMSF